MSWFTRTTKVGRPQAAPQVGGNIPFKNYGVIVQPGLQPLPTGNDSRQTILQHLAEIEAFAPGLALFQAILATGKQVGVKYAGPLNNQAAGTARGYYILRMKHDAQDNLGFSQELALAIGKMTAAGHDMNWLANQLYNVTIPTWNGGSMLSPYRTAPLVVPPGQAVARPMPQTPIVTITAQINAYIAQTARPSNDEMDAIMLVLEPWLTPGLGCATRVDYDPNKVIVNGQMRPAQCGLFHELTHALYNVQGRQLGREDSANEGNGGRLFEAAAVGFGPFAARAISENAYRAALGVLPRGSYP